MKISQAVKFCLDYHEDKLPKKIRSPVTSSFFLNFKPSLAKETSDQ